MADLESSAIAIVGMAGRFPGAKDLEAFWHNLRDGVESISFFSEDELLAEGISPALIRKPNYVKARGILGDVDQFDAPFFGLNAREAALLDPQHRLFLECGWEAFEDAGFSVTNAPGRVGIFAGASMNTYMLTYLYPQLNLVQSVESLQVSIGNDKDSLTTEVAYRMGLTGPAVTIQSSSSTSLVAVHYACQSLLTYECDVALAGGVSIHLPEKAGYLFYEGGITSSDGHCRTFDARAEGFVAGHGAGVVVLRRLSDALADGDTIHAVIRGSAVNNDGSLKVSYMAPGVEGQAEVIALAQAVAGVGSEDISYVEAHGTGTRVGDPIEIAALTQAFRAGTAKKGYCALGSVKANIGHLDSAAGVAGLIKTTLALEHKQIPPIMHFECPNPNIDFANSPFYVNARLRDWEPRAGRRIAGVSSFGMGGTNAHAIVEEAPPTGPSDPSRASQLLLLSAQTDSALETMTDRLAAHLRLHPELNLADVAYTLQVGRKHFEHRRVLLCQDREDAIDALANRDPERIASARSEAKSRPIMFMFSGQGSQYVNMGRALYEQEPVFREALDTCAALLKPHLGLDLIDLLYPNEEHTEKASLRLTETRFTQPALFALEYALAQLWMAWGVRPQAMIGHSLGEYVAACLAGVFSLGDGLALVSERGRLMQKMPGGVMLGVALAERDVAPYLSASVSLAAVNGPANCVLSGSYEAIDELQRRLDSNGVKCTRLHTSHAFHSAMMEPIFHSFHALVSRVNLHAPSLPYISNVSGAWITAEQATSPDYWAAHLRQCVRFSDGICQLLKEPDAIFLEVGPGNTLRVLCRQHLDGPASRVVLSSMRHSHERQSDLDFSLSTLGHLWLAGVDIDWPALYAKEHRRRVPLPTYPFERARYWVDATGPSKSTVRSETSTADRRLEPSDWFYLPSWQQTLAPARLQSGSLAEHPATWMLFVPDGASGLAAALASRLARDGQAVVTVTQADGFTQVGEVSFSLGSRPEDYEALLAALEKNNWLPSRVIHLWGAVPAGPLTFEKAQESGLYSLLFLVQAWEKRNPTAPLDITVVTHELYQVTDMERVLPEKATILGICKVAPQEYTNLSCNIIDVSLSRPDCQDDDWLADCVLAECLSTDKNRPAVAYRGRRRWLQTFHALDRGAIAHQDALIRPKGVYLIVGGLGEIGSAFSQELARSVRANLILTGRTELPERELWASWLADHEEEDPVSYKIRRIQELEACGSQVLYVPADVTRRAEMEMAVGRAIKQFGVIHGVVYSAGAVNRQLFKPVKDTDLASIEAQFAVRVQGLNILQDVLRDQRLDFCILTSSLASLVGGLGLAGYGAASAFMDAFACRHNQTSPEPWLSVDWDGWQSATTQFTSMGDEFAKRTITSAEGAEAFRFLLALAGRSSGQLAVSTRDLPSRLQRWLAPSQATEPKEEGRYAARPNLQTTYTAPRNNLERAIVAIWSEVLGLKQVGVYDNFFELGGNSLVGVRLIAQLNEKLGVHIPAVSLYEAPTVSALTKTINQARGDSEQPKDAGDAGRQRGQHRLERMRNRANNSQN